MSLSILLCSQTPLISDQLQLALQNALHDVTTYDDFTAISLKMLESYDVLLVSPEDNPESLASLAALCKNIRSGVLCHMPIVAYLAPGNQSLVSALDSMLINEIFAFTPVSQLRDFCLKISILHRRCQLLQKMQHQLEFLEIPGQIDVILPENVRYEIIVSPTADAVLTPAINNNFPVNRNLSLQQFEQTLYDSDPKIVIIDLAVGRDALKLASKINSLHPETPMLLMIPDGYNHWINACSDLGLGNVIVYPDHSILLDNKISQLHCWCAFYQFYRREIDLQMNRAIIDDLTGLFNRRYLDHALNRHISNASKFAFLLVDIDHFKAINDTYGHLFGDEVLRILSRRMLSQFRPHDTVGRWGGEEFVIILDNVDAQTAVSLAERLRQYQEEHVLTIEHQDGEVIELQVTISIGISLLTEGDTFNSVINRADDSLYKAKANGRNQVVYAPEIIAQRRSTAS